MKGMFVKLVARDLRLAVRSGGGGGLAVLFFLAAIIFMPLGVGPDLNILAHLAPGLLWVALLLSALLTLDRMFQADLEDGSLDLMMLAPLPLELIVVGKCLAHWLTTGLPLLVVAVPLGLMLNLPTAAFLPLLAALAVGTPALSLLGAVGAALTAGVRRGGLLASLLVMPLYVPVLIFGVSASESGLMAGGSGAAQASLMLLGALSLASLVVGPLAAAAALRLLLD